MCGHTVVTSKSASLDKRDWVLGFLKPQEAWPAPPGSGKFSESQEDINSCKRVKVKPDLHFCVETDYDINLRPEIISWSPQN